MTARFGDIQSNRRERLIEKIVPRQRTLLYLKLGLGFAAVALLGVMMILPLLEEEQGGMRIAFSKLQEGEDSQPVMLNPKFQGVDQKNQPYTVTAARAVQKDANTIELEKLVADLTMKDTSWLSLTAKRGLLQLDKRQLYLIGNVQAFHDAGYEMRTEQMRIDTSTGDAFGDKPVEGQGPVGYFRGQGFAIYDKGNRMIFAGRVTLTITPHAS